VDRKKKEWSTVKKRKGETQFRNQKKKTEIEAKKITYQGFRASGKLEEMGEKT